MKHFPQLISARSGYNTLRLITSINHRVWLLNYKSIGDLSMYIPFDSAKIFHCELASWAKANPNRNVVQKAVDVEKAVPARKKRVPFSYKQLHD